jgi:hypothetical protein
MITATCINPDCRYEGYAVDIEGFPDPVMCGICGQEDELSNPRPDPETVVPE